MPGFDHPTIPYPVLLRLPVIPGHTHIWEIFYPLVSWMGVTGLGLLFGELLKRGTHRAGRVAIWTGLGLLVLFVIIRNSGGFGSLDKVPAEWMGFL